MDFNMRKLSIFLLFMAVSMGSPCFAQNPTRNIVDYGDFYLVEKDERVPPTWSFVAQGGLVFSNPYVNSQFLDGSVLFGVGRFLRVGIQGVIFKNKLTDVANALETELRDLGFTQPVTVRSKSIYLKVVAIPFSGNMSFFGFNRMPIDFQISLAPGGSWYQLQEITRFQKEIGWRLGIAMYLTPYLALTPQIGQTIGIGSGSLTDVLGSIGVDFYL